MTDPHWLVKDFHVLYRSANEFVQHMHGVNDEAAQNALDGLVAQLSRLRPAFEVCEAERKGGSPRAVRALRDLGYPKSAAAIETKRLTEPERKALNALHRWLHSPAGDYMLTEEAADFHEQIEVECAEDCQRLEEEERMAWGQLQREMAGRTCRVCGCTDEDCSQCVEKTGAPCHWVAPSLCSACEVKP